MNRSPVVPDAPLVDAAPLVAEAAPVADRAVAAGNYERVTDRIYLALAVGVLALSAFLRVDGPKNVVVPGVQFTLPETCHLRRLTGVDCAGCGLTRSFVRLAHGDVVGSWEVHPVGPFVFLFVAVQIPYRAWQLWRARTGRGRWRGGPWLNAPLILLAAAMLGRWALHLGRIYL